jgi:hypothetical protein
VTQAQDESGATPLQGMPARVEPNVDDVPLGAISIDANRVESMVHGASPGTPGHTAPRDTVSAPGFPVAVGLGVARLLLSKSPRTLCPPINWGQVEDHVEQACSHVTAAGRLL